MSKNDNLSRVRAKDRPTAYLLLCHKVFKKSKVERSIESINGSTPVEDFAYRSFISRREVDKKIRHLPKKDREKVVWKEGVTISELINLIWPSPPEKNKEGIKKKKIKKKK